jgi:hypothetical protein
MRAGYIAQDMIVLRPLQTRRGGTSTERLKTGAEQFLAVSHILGAPSFSPHRSRVFHSPIRLNQGAASCSQFFSALLILSSRPFLKSFNAPWLPQT